MQNNHQFLVKKININEKYIKKRVKNLSEYY